MKNTDPSQRLKQIIELQSHLIALKFDLHNFMNEVVGRLQQLTSATGAIVELVDEDFMAYAAVSGSAEAFLGYRINRINSLSGLSVATGEILYCRDVNHDPRVNIEACKEVGVLSMIVVPLIRLGEIVGVLKVISGIPHAFDEADIEILQLTAGLLGAALGQQIEIQERSRIEAKLTHIAHTDPLTGLPNRSLFYDRLQQALHRLGARINLLRLCISILIILKPLMIPMATWWVMHCCRSLRCALKKYCDHPTPWRVWAAMSLR